jgi:hypothetical protein
MEQPITDHSKARRIGSPRSMIHPFGHLRNWIVSVAGLAVVLLRHNRNPGYIGTSLVRRVDLDERSRRPIGVRLTDAIEE